MNAPATGLIARPNGTPTLRFALRDLRGGLAGLRIFLLCIALGVAAIVGVESLALALNDGMGREGRVILGGDASFALIHRRLSADEQRFLEAHGSLSTIATLRGMARVTSGDAALIEIKAVEPSWPRIGQAAFAPPMSLEDALGERDGMFGAAVEEALLARLNLELGGVIRIGETNFVVRTLLVSEPDRLATGVGLGPRVLISQAALDATKLIQPGSLVRWTSRVIMDGAPDNAAVQAFMGEAKRTFPQAGWDARTRLAINPDFSRDLDRFAEFLTLAGLLSLVVGGVGVANAAQGFVERKRATLAILKAIGATGSGVVGLALVEFMIVALDRRVSRGGAGLGDSLRRQLAVRLPAADSARALDLARPHRPRADLRIVDGARLLGRAARTRPRSARDHADPRSCGGAPGLAAHALSCRRCARRRRACCACRPDQPATIGRGDGRRRDGRCVHRTPACRPTALPISRGARPVRALSNGAWRLTRSTGLAR